MKKLWSIITLRTTPRQLAAVELEEARVKLLAELTAQEYATNMSNYYQTKILRLEGFLTQGAK